MISIYQLKPCNNLVSNKRNTGVWRVKTIYQSGASVLFCQFLVLLVAPFVVYHPYGQRTAWAFRNILSLFYLVQCYHELISAGARVEELEGVDVEVEVLDFDFVVYAGNAHC